MTRQTILNVPAEMLPPHEIVDHAMEVFAEAAKSIVDMCHESDEDIETPQAVMAITIGMAFCVHLTVKNLAREDMQAVMQKNMIAMLTDHLHSRQEVDLQ
jgi:hypothetical protein